MRAVIKSRFWEALGGTAAVRQPPPRTVLAAGDQFAYYLHVYGQLKADGCTRRTNLPPGKKEMPRWTSLGEIRKEGGRFTAPVRNTQTCPLHTEIDRIKID